MTNPMHLPEFDACPGPSALDASKSGVATGGQGGQSATPDSEKTCKNSAKRGENREKSGKIEENSGKWQKSGRFFHFTPYDRYSSKVTQSHTGLHES